MNQSLGTKRQCEGCGAKFYDLNASPVVCPKCSKVFSEKVKPAPKKLPKVVAAKKVLPVSLAGDDDVAIAELEGLGGVAELEELDDFDADMEELQEVEEHHEDPEVSVNSDDAEDEMFIDELSDNGMHLVDDLEEEGDDLDEDDRESGAAV